jgi:cystathionine beta-lyase/cystathionine gamma-synthase
MDEMSKLLDPSNRDPIDTKHLDEWYPEDYVRLGSPFSTILEHVLEKKKGYPPYSVLSFGSLTLPLISVMLTAIDRVFIYGGTLFTKAQEDLLADSYGCNFEFRQGVPVNHGSNVVVQLTDRDMTAVSPHADAVVRSDGFIVILNTNKIPPHDVKNERGIITQEGIHTIRKRLGSAPPTPDALAMLREDRVPVAPDATALKQHLKVLGGVENAPGDVLVTTCGLTALGACVMAALDAGERSLDLLMCSTAYGGSSQQADILVKRCNDSKYVNFTKHKFDIQGDRPVLTAITESLERMKSGPRKNLTLVQLEYPTNPDMKDCDTSHLEALFADYQRATGSRVVILCDTTFSPQSAVAKEFTNTPVIVFNSLSKSVSGGFTTGGSLVANDVELAQELLTKSHVYAGLLDTTAKPCQLQILVDQHAECEMRIRQAYENCVQAAQHLETCVKSHSGEDMKVNYVTDVQVAKNVTPATFSFNLPAPAAIRNNIAALEATAQAFVDQLITENPVGIKPCVSFGQKNTLVYATVPATSTQGVISAEDKAKQAKGGIQLVRFSFPPTMDMTAWNAAIENVVQRLYAARSAL